MSKQVVAGLLALILLLAGCAGNNAGNGAQSINNTPANTNNTTNAPGAQTQEPDPVTITFWTTDEANYAELLAEFQTERPHITVKAEYMGNYDDMAAKVMAGVVANNLPHVVQLGQRHGISQIVDSGRMIPIEEFMTSEEIADVPEAYWERYTYKGQKWTIPFESSSPMMYYNKTMFDEANIPEPQTWDDAVAAAAALTKDGVWGMNWHTDAPWYFQPLTWNRGGRLLDANGKPTINSPEAVDTLGSLQKLVHEDKSMPANRLNTSREDFVSGKLAIYFRSSSSLAGIKNSVGDAFEIGLTFLPMVTERWVPIGGNSLGIFASDDAHEQASWELIKFLTSPEITARVSMATGYVPVRKSALDLPEFQAHLEADADFEKTIASMDYLRGQPISPADAIIWDGILNAIEIVGSDANANPQQIMDELQAEVEAYLNSYE